jgi:hypothetical protein
LYLACVHPGRPEPVLDVERQRDVFRQDVFVAV